MQQYENSQALKQTVTIESAKTNKSHSSAEMNWWRLFYIGFQYLYCQWEEDHDNA